MNLDSARELKSLLLRKSIRPLAATAKRVSALGIGARAVDRIDEMQRTIALSISPRSPNDFRLAVRIQTRAFENSPQIEEITKQAKGEADVRYIGRVVKRALPCYQSRQRPLLIGSSIGHFRITAGTLGCFVKTRKDGLVRILSNNHVLANENAGRRGDPVTQPGRFDSGKRGKDTVGALDSFVRLTRTSSNLVDAAIATVRDGIQFDGQTLRDIGQLNGSSSSILETGDEVRKVGRTTGLRPGRVTAFELDNVIVGYDMGNLRFDDQIEIEGAETGPFSQGGDSGSLIFNGDRQAVALLFAGGDQGGSNGQGLTYANPISKVLDELKVDRVI